MPTRRRRPPPKRRVCLDTAKIRYPDKRSAVEAIHRIHNTNMAIAEMHGYTPDHEPTRAYECECGGYHLTSWE